MASMKPNETWKKGNVSYTRQGNGDRVKVHGPNTSTRYEPKHRTELRFNQGK